jgi:hypothetical protein
LPCSPPKVVQQVAANGKAPWFTFNDATGAFEVHGLSPWQPAIPQSDGQPLLRGAIVQDVQVATNIMAISAWLPVEPFRKLLILRAPDCVPVAALPIHRDFDMRLSEDGSLVAVPTNSTEVSVYKTNNASPLSVMPPGQVHGKLSFLLGDEALVVFVGNGLHLFRWDHGALDHVFQKNYGGDFLEKVLGWSTYKGLPTTRSEDAKAVSNDSRFRVMARRRMIVYSDDYDNLAIVRKSNNELIAVLTVCRGRAAGWLPDGTRWGDATIHGPASPGAAEIFGRVLREAV